MAAVRHKLREQAMTSLYQHLLLKKDIRKYFWKIFAKPYLYNLKENMKLAVKCVMVLMNDKSLGKRYV